MLTPDNLIDQASGLRQMVNPKPVRAIAVTGGKGGVGKTNVSVNLGVAAAEMGQKVMLAGRRPRAGQYRRGAGPASEVRPVARDAR